MLAYDFLTVSVLTIALLAALFSALRNTRWPSVLAGVALLTGLAHLAIEGARWQLVPVYVVLAVWLAIVVAKKTVPRCRRWLAARSPRLVMCALASAVLLVMIAISASYLFPMFRLPPPSGPFPVGTAALHFTDQARYELHTVYPLDRRELMVRVWYPAQAVADARLVAYMENADVMSPALAQGYSLPLPFIFTHFKLIPTHSVLDAPLSAQKSAYPVVVFSHGRDIYGVANTALMEDLASRGYVVFAIDHTYGATATAFPDGRVVNFVDAVYEAHEPDSETAPADEARAIKAYSSTDIAELTGVIQEARRLRPMQAAVTRYGLAIWSADQRFVIGEIEKLQSGQTNSAFAGHLDLSRLGVMGMSFGGSSTVMTCATDQRCKAGVNLDGFSPELIAMPAVRQPFMYASGGEQNFNLALFERGPNWNYWFKIVTSRHGDYTDLPLVTPLWKLAGMSGSIAPNRAIAITNTYVAAFFDKHLQGVPAALLDAASGDYPEVRFRAKAPVAAPAAGE
jgi:predicted dienelactone hydrolase